MAENKPPIGVSIENQDPITVTVDNVSAVTNQEPLPPTTTKQQDLVVLGQRHVNLIWESTQAVIAVIVTVATVYAALSGKESAILGNAFTLIIAIYFVRMNHTVTGGVGQKTNDPR